jgi:hypothetical protein
MKRHFFSGLKKLEVSDRRRSTLSRQTVYGSMGMAKLDGGDVDPMRMYNKHVF